MFAPTPKAAKRTVEFFTAQIDNDHTRRSYLNATRRFGAWCKTNGIEELVDVEPFHVAGFIKELEKSFSPPTVKQHLAALRMLFDWLVTGHIMEMNPAHSVRGPKYVVKRGKTPVLSNDEARSLLDSIDISTLKGLRDRALIGIMVYTFARVNAVIRMKVRTITPRGVGAGFDCMRKAARSTRCPAIIRSRPISTSISPRPTLPRSHPPLHRFRQRQVLRELPSSRHSYYMFHNANV